MRQTDQQQYEQEVRAKKTTGIPLNGCFYLIILCALACISVKGCKMVNMKYKEAKVKHEIYMDSLNKIKNDTIQYKGR